MTLQEKYDHAIRALKNIASRTFSNREVYAAAQLKELGEDYPRWINTLTKAPHRKEMEKLISGLPKGR